jgi:hypothetical protein
MLPQLLSPIATAAVHGNCLHDCTAVPSSVTPPPLSPIVIVLPLLLSPIVTPAVTHCRHHCPSQLCRHPAIHCAVATIVYCNHLSTIAHCRYHHPSQYDAAHSDCSAIPSSNVMQPTLPIVIMPPPMLSLTAATAIHGNCHHNCTAIPLSITPPPLSPIAILLPPLTSPITTPSVTHRRHHDPLQSNPHLTIHCTVDAIVQCNFSAIMPHCITS